MFLVLDKNVQRIPWESLPILRGRSVSRIPSTSFLIDRIQLARHRQSMPFVSSSDSKDTTNVDRVQVDPARVRYVLNPKGDLKHTEKQFGPWLKRMTKEAGWTGIIGRKPSEEEMARSLTGSDLFMCVPYDCYDCGPVLNVFLDISAMVVVSNLFVRKRFAISHNVRRRCSGVVRLARYATWVTLIPSARHITICSPDGMCRLFPNSMPIKPLTMVLSPTLIATLWDVTDRECDRFAQSVFTSLGLDERRNKPDGKDGTSVVQAVATAREVCKLKYLTGAAPVVYGIPFYL
jgi:separase